MYTQISPANVSSIVYYTWSMHCNVRNVNNAKQWIWETSFVENCLRRHLSCSPRAINAILLVNIYITWRSTSWNRMQISTLIACQTIFLLAQVASNFVRWLQFYIAFVFAGKFVFFFHAFSQYCSGTIDVSTIREEETEEFQAVFLFTLHTSIRSIEHFSVLPDAFSAIWSESRNRCARGFWRWWSLSVRTSWIVI